VINLYPKHRNLIFLSTIQILFILLSTTSIARQVQTKYEIYEWLILPVFPLNDGPRALDLSYFSEPDIAPSPSKQMGLYTWQTIRSKNNRIDMLHQNYARTTNCAVYAFVYIHASKTHASKLLMGSDDGIAAWVNGEQVWNNHLARGHSAEDDIAAIQLREGWNRLLLKISQLGGGWAFSCSVSSNATLRFSLDNPLPDQWPSIENWQPGIRLLNCYLGEMISPDTIRVKMDIMSFYSSPVDQVSIDLIGMNDAVLNNLKLEILNPTQIVSGHSDVSLLDVAKTSATGSMKIRIHDGKNAVSTPVLNHSEIQLVSLLCQSDQAIPEEIKKAAKSLRNLFIVYRPAINQFKESAQDALVAYFDNDFNTLESLLETMVEQLIEQYPDRSTDVAYLLGHAHIDMNWLWTYDETLKTSHDTFRQVLAFMEEYEDMTYIQSQPYIYQAMELIDPAMFSQILQRVQEGRWELAGGMLVEGDTNLPGGEALARSFLLGQRYFLTAFGKIATTGWLPDNFGHTAQLPQILRLAGCDSYYFHRCHPYLGLFTWQAPDGSRVSAYSNHTYSGTIQPALMGEFDKLVPETRQLLHLTGVGDHGGGPTRRDIEMAQLLQETPRFPTVKFSTAKAFFEDGQANQVSMPVHQGEMQYVFEGCYSSVSRIKEGNRLCESRLAEAEWVCVWNQFEGYPYPQEKLNDAWGKVVFNQFHDILPGTAIHESNQDAVANYRVALNEATQIRDRALRNLADRILIDQQKGQPVVVFNPQPKERTSIVEAEIFTHELPKTVKLSRWTDYDGGEEIEPVDVGQGAVPSILVEDSEGNVIPAQIIWGKQFPPGWRSRIQFIAEALPAGGYRTYYVHPDHESETSQSIQVNENSFETDYYKIRFNMETGEIAELYDKCLGMDYVASDQTINQLKIFIEDAQTMDAWNIGNILDIQNISNVESIRVTENGPVRACVEVIKTWGKSKFVQKTYLYQRYPRIDFDLEVHWFEQGGPDQNAPMLRVTFPLNISDPEFNCHVPFYIAQRPINGQEVPAQKWVDISNASSGMALLNQTKYGHSFEDGELRLTLLRSSYHPDVYPDQGLHRIKYALFPHGKHWASDVWVEGNDFNCPAMAVEPPSFALKKNHVSPKHEASYLNVSPHNIQLTGLKKTEDSKEIVLRMVEILGEQTETTIQLAYPVRSVRRINLIEESINNGERLNIKDGKITVNINPYEIVSLAIDMETN